MSWRFEDGKWRKATSEEVEELLPRIGADPLKPENWARLRFVKCVRCGERWALVHDVVCPTCYAVVAASRTSLAAQGR